MRFLLVSYIALSLCSLNASPEDAKRVIYRYLQAWQQDRCEDAVLCVPPEGREGWCKFMDRDDEWQTWLRDGFEIELKSFEEKEGFWKELGLTYSARAEFYVTIQGEKMAEWYVLEIDGKWYVQQ